MEKRAVFLKNILFLFAGEDISGTTLVEYTRKFVLSGSVLKNTPADEAELRQNLEVFEEWLLRCLWPSIQTALCRRCISCIAIMQNWQYLQRQ